MKAIIIHSSCLIQCGLKNILQSKNIAILEVMDDFPDAKKLIEFEEILLFSDLKFKEIIYKNRENLRKKRNKIVGISIENKGDEEIEKFDEIIYLNDDFSVVLGKIDAVLPKTEADTNSQLSSRELEILSLVAKGLSNRKIADKLFISIHTVITHRKNITAKLGIKTIAGLTMYASINNLI